MARAEWWKMRPANGPYKQEAYTEGMVHLPLTLSAETHKRIIERLNIDRTNRMDWIRQAIDEKLRFDEKTNDAKK